VDTGPDSVARWSPHPPHELKIRVRISPGRKEVGKRQLHKVELNEK
jgi:hypothetical protein